MEVSTNQRLIKEHRGQRKPKNIQIETYANIVSGEEAKGVLPKSSREQTPLTETSEASSVPDTPNEVKFFSGNPFVEQTTGILHLYKKKYDESPIKFHVVHFYLLTNYVSIYF